MVYSDSQDTVNYIEGIFQNVTLLGCWHVKALPQVEHLAFSKKICTKRMGRNEGVLASPTKRLQEV